MAKTDTWDESEFRARVGVAIEAFIDEQAALLTDLGADAESLVEHARISTGGGKRLRAAFCFWGHLAVAPTEDAGQADALVRACAALELLHASALVHDDYMDASDTRRGRPATHRAFEQSHADSGLVGSGAQYGAAAAILLGDLLLSWADEMLRRCGLPAERVLSALRRFDVTRSEVIAGQFLDVSVQARRSADVATAMRVLRYKSAKYSIERPLHIGAALAGASPAQEQALTDFGLPLGEAFQLRDDLLGVFGDPAVTGKPAGDDLVEGKRTVLVAHALQGLDAADAEHLDSGLGTPLSPGEVKDLCALIEKSGARAEVEDAITTLTEQSLAALDAAAAGPDALRPEAVDVLRALAVAATQRAL